MLGRSIATTLMWLTYLFMISTNIAQLGSMIIILALVLMIPLVAVTAMMWGVFEHESQHQNPAQQTAQDEIEKRKRERIDDVLRDMSDEDLVRLKQRLATGVINDDDLYNNLVGDDGELVDYSG